MKRWAVLLLLATPLHATSNLISSMTWTESGDYKMPRQDSVPFIGTAFCSTCTISRVWDGTNIKLFGGQGELITWVTYLEASAAGDAQNVMVTLSSFTGTGTALGSGFSAVAVSSTNVWDYTTRPYSLYRYGYLQVLGMSQIDIAWDPSEYDQQQLPPRWRVPCVLNGNNQCPPTGATQLWANRQDNNKFYPDIAVPMEEYAISSFTVSASSSQAIGGEVYVSTALPAGVYTSTLTVWEGAAISTTIPVQLLVYNVQLPPTATLPVVADIGLSDLSMRYYGTRFPASYTVDPYLTTTLRVGAFLHRHKVTPIGDVFTQGQDYPSPIWSKFMDGSAFTATYGAAYNTGPGFDVSDSTYVIGMYGSWVGASFSTSATQGSNDFCTNISSFTGWCVNNNKKCYLYTANDEASDAVLHTEDNGIAQLLSTSTPCAFSGTRVQYVQTGRLPTVASTAPYINAVWSTSWMDASSATWVADETLYQNTSTRSVAGYNSAIGVDSILNTQEEGLGPREPLWGAYKTNQSLWFLWEINYWNDTNNGGQTQNGFNANTNNDNNMFNIAKDFGYDIFPSTSSVRGHYGFDFTSGDGDLLYYGTDSVYNSPHFGVNAIFGSWRLNQLTRGIQDVDIIKLAFARNPSATTAIVNQQVQDVMYTRQCFTLSDCTYSYGPRPWNQTLSSWETARESLLQIAAGLPPGFPSETWTGTINSNGTINEK